MNNIQWQGYLRKDGRKGIRNYVLVVYVAEGSYHVAKEINARCKDYPVQLVGFAGCDPDANAEKVINAMCVHPNVGAVLLITTGFESFDCKKLEDNINQTGRPVNTVTIKEAGGTANAIEAGVDWVDWCLGIVEITLMVQMTPDDLIVGVVSGGSDATSAITGNPTVGKALNIFRAHNGTAISAETRKLIALEDIVSNRAENPELAEKSGNIVGQASEHYFLSAEGNLAVSNASMGLTSIEEESMSSYCKAGDSRISGLLKPGERPAQTGLYLMDVPYSESASIRSDANDTMGIVDLISSGCHLIIYSTGKGSVVGSAISPVIKICSNSETYRRMPQDVDYNTGGLMEGEGTLDKAAYRIFEGILAVACGIPTCSEGLRHQEFRLKV
jgi:altronate dehydratase large subunit